MSTADSRFVAARRALRSGDRTPPVGCPPDRWEAALRSQALLRGLDAGLTIPIAVARAWALNAASRAIDYPSQGPHAAVVVAAEQVDGIQALRGWYARSEQVLHGPYDSLEQAIRATRAARGHGRDVKTEDRTALEDAVSAV